MALVNMCPYNFGKYAGVGQGSFVHINHDVWRTDLRWNPSEVFFERPFIESVMVHGGRFKLYSIQWEAIEPLTSSRGEGRVMLVHHYGIRPCYGNITQIMDLIMKK
jgi:hypothetical protein